MKPPVPYLPPLPNPGIQLKKTPISKNGKLPTVREDNNGRFDITNGFFYIKSRKKTYHTRKNIQWRGAAVPLPTLPTLPPINFSVATAGVVTIAVAISIVKKTLKFRNWLLLH
ncbi:hypothetical protein Salat_0630700 [Sesamum alatum]|uniref:Uncharacterized protein n=1 Tax=Sesamum alatum TaxID=300844 RepID=A0AAE1YR31_9LAMI|nr:hypothetical protein Salat_0630700 [Sesamum alatum]